MKLEEIYRPIADDLKDMESILESSVKESKNRSIQAMSSSLLRSGGKKLRPALVILSEKAASANKKSSCNNDELIMLASAVELIHIASLIHDDVLDGATMRRNKPSINAELGDDISIIFGDYIYSKAFDLIGKCRSPDVFECISQAIREMCEGELIQVYQRGNLDLSKDNYITIVGKKTASLLAACCHAGGILGNHNQTVQGTLKRFGMNFGIAFQIIDDCKDLISEERILGKQPGQDMIAGDMTLPLLDLLDAVDKTEKQEIKKMFESEIDQKRLEKIRKMFVNSNAFGMTRQTALFYINQAKCELDELEDSDYKRSLNYLTDYIIPGTLFNSGR
ncbi:MAG: polyprenyl synthetase family protein [Sedimentisphaerales bacterium]|nr:polyprenyl synthetase family protein [Sedimentisphaerales bacterium]